MKRFTIPTLIFFCLILLASPTWLSWAAGSQLAPAATLTPTPVTNTISLQVKASVDDTSVRLATDENLYDWAIIRIGASQTDYVNGIRFQDVAIPQGARIVQARLLLYYGEWTRGVPIRLQVRGDDSDMASSFADSEPLASKRQLTTAAVGWEITQSPEDYSWFESPDLSAVVQEIVDRAGWRQGNALALIIGTAANNEINHYLDTLSYDYRPDVAPKLEIVYESTAPIPTSTPTATPTPTVTPTPEPGRLAIEQAQALRCDARTTGDTRTWSNNVVIYTACRRSWPETGPEAVFKLSLPFDNTDVQLQVFADDPGQDLDVFLLDGAYPDQCLQGADANLIQKQLDAGDYYVAVDGYNGAAGAFTLISRCTIHFPNDLYLPVIQR